MEMGKLDLTKIKKMPKISRSKYFKEQLSTLVISTEHMNPSEQKPETE